MTLSLAGGLQLAPYCCPMHYRGGSDEFGAMDLRRLRHAVALGKWLNFRKASESINITQSALSRSIQSLERDYGVRLFDRNNASVHLTAAGRIFVDGADAILKSQLKLDALIRQTASAAVGEITVGLSPIAAKAFLAPMLSEFVDLPGVYVRAVITNQKELHRSIIDEKADFCVTASLGFAAGAALSKTFLGRFSYGLLVRAGHPLADHGMVTPSHVKEFPLIASDHMISSEYIPVSFQPLEDHRPAVVVESYDTLLAIALATDAIWATAPVALSSDLESGRLRKLTAPWMEAHEFELFAYHLRGRELSPIAGRVLAKLQALAERELAR